MADKSINEIQEEIINEFSILAGDKESTIFYIMDLAKKLDPLEQEHYADENLVKGCQSKVWLISSMENGEMIYKADSNTDITKGLISLLIRIFNHQKPQDIVDAELYFIDKIGMGQIVGSQRSNGFSNMIKQMKYYAFAYKAKMESAE